MAKKYTIIVGLDYDKAGNRMEDMSFETGYVEQQMVDAFGGFTRTLAIGGYKHDDGHVVTERSYVYTILDTQPSVHSTAVAKTIALVVKGMFKQESVVFTVEEARATFL